MIKIAAVCSTGVGSSMMVDMNMQSIIGKWGLDDQVESTHMDMGSANYDAADHFFVGRDLKDAAEDRLGDKVTVLESIIDQDELAEKLKNFLKDQGIM
ncbi:PTS lactose transporter subunit IIB [Pediococcus acidilactici]|uniref:PTS sugar transporter subunit IIB n=1 Tax=Pediococcus acidilactici TaxID=1254 RepID=UPI000E5D8C37|nr:PTS sugar transporter subunit IIB [Pediococcus acidilactici]KAF0369068.1 PTS lactose transporter subunit IIB [Pediococcus acidilactici]KAF0465848.1 PTS lactose transporter subunit IIB [Pediococcus acidilactici]KAF0471030.1 PTS lactose transporter subunit IIB [Pediococcus acidilactici]KAF0491397.1 PTS lactose transporter subunit IIB [Pediococcus acidilactici]KAF0515716.1 PTS lactose transporter subunit IIB [Pediococcus acidilactici]